jgi:hypothetical protein
VPLPGESRLETLGRTYVEEIVPRRVDILGQLQAYAAAEDPEVAEVMRHHVARIYRYVVAALERDGRPGANEEAASFMGRGLFITGAMAIGLESVLTDEEWAGIVKKKGIARIEDRTPAPAA